MKIQIDERITLAKQELDEVQHAYEQDDLDKIEELETYYGDSIYMVLKKQRQYVKWLEKNKIEKMHSEK